MKKILFATSNPRKVEDYNRRFESCGYHIEILDIDMNEGRSLDIREITKMKLDQAKIASKGQPVFVDGTNQTEIENYSYINNVVWRTIQGADSFNDMSVYGEEIDAVTKKHVRDCSVHTSHMNEKGETGVFYFIDLKDINYDTLGNITLIADTEYRFIPESQFKFSGQSDFSQFDKLPDAYRAQTSRTENEFDGKLHMSKILHTEYVDSTDTNDSKVIFLYNHEKQLEKMYRVSTQNFSGDETHERTSTSYTYNDQGRVATEETYTNDMLVEKLAYEYSKPN